MNRYSAILLEDKEVIGLNKIHKNVLKVAPDVIKSKAKIYYDPSIKNEYDEMVISSKILDFVSDGIKFDPQVVKKTAAYTLPYKPEAVHEIFRNKKKLDDDFIIEPSKYRVNDYTSINKAYLSLKKEKFVQDLIVYDANKLHIELDGIKPAAYKFKPKDFFIEQKLSSSETQLNADSKRELAGSQLKSARSLSDLNDSNQPEVGIFLTEAPVDGVDKEKPHKNEKKVLYEAERDLKELNEINWDDHLINLLSEGTARWIVMKRVTDANQRQRLLEVVEKKFGRYTRDIKDLELVEDNLTDFEKRKIAEEKERVRMENEKKNQVHVKIVDKQEEESKDKDIPLYRLPQGNKRAEIEKLKMPDPSYNKTARNINVESSRILSPKSFQNKMQSKNITDMTLFKSDNEYHLEMVSGNIKHVISQDENLIKLENGKSFVKTVQNVFPTEFTAWVTGIELTPNDKPEMKKPIKGKKKWKRLPHLIDDSNINRPTDENTNYWHLMPTTPDTQLRKILKTNQTVARVVDEWRKKWQTSNRWSLAEIDQLIKDMGDDHANVRFQAVVVCSRAAEQLIIMYDKLERFNKKKHSIREVAIIEEKERRKSKKLVEDELDSGDDKIKILEDEDRKERDTKREMKDVLIKSANSNLKNAYRSQYQNFNETFFPDDLYDKIEMLLNDSNYKVKLAAAIAIFTILRRFIRPLTQRFQSSKDKAEAILRLILETYNNSDKYAAAQCLAIDGFCDRLIVQILLNNYFSSNEQVTKEQVTQSLSDLSPYHPLVSLMIEEYLDSEHPRERILSIKLFPCLRMVLSKHATQKLIELMWNDMNRSVRKCAAQTLGRTGRGQQVHDEICVRLKSQNSFDKIEALNKLNHIGIMTNELLSHYVKCFYDDYISVRELACKTAQSLFEKDEKVLGALIFMARFDKVPKLKALAIRTIGLIGDMNEDIRKCLLWALQFESDPHVKTESCHSLILLEPNKKDQDLIDILHERHLVEEEPIVQQEIKNALDYFGFDPNKELPIVAKIKSDVKKLNDKNVIIQKIKELEKEINFKMDKDRFIWNEEEEQRKKSSRSKSGKKKSLNKKQEQKVPEIFEPKQVVVNENAKNSIDQISKYLGDTKKNSKMARSLNNSRTNKSKSKPANFLSKLVSTPSEDRNLNSSFRSFSGELTSNTFNEFLNANKKLHKTSSDDGHQDNEDAKSEESDNYFEQYTKGPKANTVEQANVDRSISYVTTVATISSQRIDTILEEAD